MLTIDMNRYNVFRDGEQLDCLECIEDKASAIMRAVTRSPLRMRITYLDENCNLHSEVVDHRDLMILQKSRQEVRDAQFWPYDADEIDPGPEALGA